MAARMPCPARRVATVHLARCGFADRVQSCGSARRVTMPGTSPDVEVVARLLLWLSIRLVLAMTAIVVAERAVSALIRARGRQLEDRYRPLVRRRARGRRRGGRTARGGPGAAPSRHRQAPDRTAHRRSRPCSHRAHARDRRRPVVHSDRRPVPAQLAVVAPRRRASRAGRAAAARPHGGGRSPRSTIRIPTSAPRRWTP